MKDTDQPYPSNPIHNILIVEDDMEAASFLQMVLQKTGYMATACYDGGTAQKYVQYPMKWDMAIVDLNLPDMNGLDLCLSFKKNPQTRKMPIIMLTSDTSNQSRINALLNHVDIYLNKPIQPEELARTVEALLNESEIRKKMFSTLKIGPFEINPEERTVSFNDKTISDMNGRLFDALYLIVSGYPRPVNRKLLTKHIASTNKDIVAETWVCRLRTRLAEEFGVDLIETVVGSGYRLKIPAPEPAHHP